MSNTSSSDSSALHEVEKCQIVIVGPHHVALRGEIEMRDPVAAVGPHIRKIHEGAAGTSELLVDLSALRYVNSSGLRIFLDWLGWLTAEPPERRYRLRFRLSESSSWQAAAFPAIEMLGGEMVAIERG